ncbi:hypothetical protein HNQ80_001599 [Anaerosolibacter carboniphilus]|uniref:Uncharacterized protein n=1 Tax=Anaerosolibacter carboniphilus TaxID=1417629 RepID=A0A841KU06_9FIRM|nr:hypothetical protein [Anaerosolibacter carboniphilus]
MNGVLTHRIQLKLVNQTINNKFLIWKRQYRCIVFSKLNSRRLKMKQKRKYSILIHLFTFIQIILVGAVSTIENLSHKKMGVMRHLVYRNHVFQTTWFTSELMYLYRIILIACFVIHLGSLIKNLKYAGKTFLTSHLITLGVNLSLVLLFFNSGLSAYYYWIITALICLVIQYFKMIMHIVAFKKLDKY